MDKKSRYELGMNLGGRPPVYETPDDMIKRATEYFEIETSKAGICKPTISGLVYHLGFASRTSWYDYKKKSPEFMHTVLRLKQFVESCYEKNLHGFAWAGSQFALKNINSTDWKDEVTQNQNQTVTQVTITEKKRDE